MDTMERPDNPGRAKELLEEKNQLEEEAVEQERQRHSTRKENIEEKFKEQRKQVAYDHLNFDELQSVKEEILEGFEQLRTETGKQTVEEQFHNHLLDHLAKGGHPKDEAQVNRSFSVRDDGVHRYNRRRNSKLDPSNFTQGNTRHSDLQQALGDGESWETAKKLIEAYNKLNSTDRITKETNIPEGLDIRFEATSIEVVVKNRYNGNKVQVLIKGDTYHRERTNFNRLLEKEETLKLLTEHPIKLFNLFEQVRDGIQNQIQENQQVLEDIGVEL